MLLMPGWVWAQPSNSSNPQVLCFGAEEPYCVDCTENGNTGTDGSTYTWTVSAASATILPNPAFPAVQTNPIEGNHIIIDWGNTPVGNYTLQVVETNADGCAGDPVVLNITIEEFPVTVNSATICSGGSVTLVATTTQPGGTFLWSNGETGASITVNPTATTDYTVIYSVPFCSEVEGTGTVTVTPEPTVTVNSETI